MLSSADKTATTAASSLITLAAAGPAVASCSSFSSSFPPELFKANLRQLLRAFVTAKDFSAKAGWKPFRLELFRKD